MIDRKSPSLESNHDRKHPIGLTESLRVRMAGCGQRVSELTITGQWRTRHLYCGCCRRCRDVDRKNLREALRKVMLSDDNPDLAITVITAATDRERGRITRGLRRREVRHQCYWVYDGDDIACQILVAEAHPERGQVLDQIDLTDARLD